MFRPRFVGLLLALITLLAYLPVARDGFVVYDDNDYVTDNHVVQNGLTVTGIKWAFTTGHASNWHPLTWLSHMMDCELFGLNAGAHHSVNMLFHTANTVLLFLLLLRLTGALGPAAFVAALFAWHPLHVESVAWISERKDVLSTCFALLSLLSYARFVKRATGEAGGKPKTENRKPKESRMPNAETPGQRRSNSDFGLRVSFGIRHSAFGFPTGPASLFYWLALIFFALGLMSKPMLVTLPFVMLLLDYWPLNRGTRDQWQVSKVLRLALEKWPFFLFAAISCVVTFLTQRHGEAMITLQQFPLPLRIENALISYLLYLSKTVWPRHLAVLYPLAIHWSWMRTMAMLAAALLGVVSWLAWQTHRQYPCLLVGWLWFLGTLVPVIGLVQVGIAAMADRYTYFPLVGIFIAIAFGVRDLARRFRLPKMAVAIAAALALAACLMLAANQLRYWHDSESLFAHTLAVTRDNVNARISYGVALEQKGRLAEALAQYREAVRISPNHAMAHLDIGNLLEKTGQSEEALPELLKAVQFNPKALAAHNALGSVLVELGRFDEALDQFQETGRLDPAYPWVPFEIGKLRLKQGRDAEAIDEFRAALRIAPDNFQILAFTAQVLAAGENPEVRDGKTALTLAIKANTLSGGAQPLVLDVLGMACAETGDFANAQEVAQRAIDLATAAKMKKLELLQQRLELYKNHQLWRESFLATNPPAKH